jgi:hypothetical protein
LTEWTVSGPEGGIAITPVANTEYIPPVARRRWSYRTWYWYEGGAS